MYGKTKTDTFSIFELVWDIYYYAPPQICTGQSFELRPDSLEKPAAKFVFSHLHVCFRPLLPYDVSWPQWKEDSTEFE